MVGLFFLGGVVLWVLGLCNWAGDKGQQDAFRVPSLNWFPFAMGAAFFVLAGVAYGFQ